VYKVEDVNIKTEAEVANPSSYLTLDAPLTRLKHQLQLDDQHADPYRQHRRASNTTKAPLTSRSVSKKTAVKHQHVISERTSMCLTPL
jgi:hypothetical protein